MPRKGGDPKIVEGLRARLHEIFVAKGGGINDEAFGEDDWLLNMSSRVNGGEELTPEQRARIEEIHSRVTHETGMR